MNYIQYALIAFTIAIPVAVAIAFLTTKRHNNKRHNNKR